jgi:hypothetical protein
LTRDAEGLDVRQAFDASAPSLQLLARYPTLSKDGLS